MSHLSKQKTQEKTAVKLYKIKLLEIDGFQTYVEVVDCVKPENYKTLRFTTVFTRSRHPEGDREAYQITLSPSAYSQLIELLENNDASVIDLFSTIP